MFSAYYELLLLIGLIWIICLAVGISFCIIKCVAGCNRKAARRRRILQRQEMEITQETSTILPQCGDIGLERGYVSEPITNEECDMNQPIPLADKPPSYSIVIRSENTSSEFKRIH